ncbi:hypothetical protein GIY62_01430 [Burkholderia plantarii]|uniref:hypothetical protein n=1 Tax=Burkholderia plantarii TaxID=41899 RepID=UPI00272AE6A9|nr:hypothetical protein [Burkholderia plantarii]WLE59391.1 hypothetical protein GIY62_01430 [Burkholderia plantarii]
MSARALVIDAHGAIEQALCSRLAAAGTRVLAHRREAVDAVAAAGADGAVRFQDGGPGVTNVCAAHPAAHLAAWDASHGPFDTIVFGRPRDASAGLGGGDDAAAEFDSLDAFDAFAERLETRLGDFLATLQAAATLLRRGGNAQIWALTQEDSMGYYLATTPAALPVDVRARHAAVKSLGKEMLRLGVKVNAAHLQPAAEEAADASAWSDARDGLKAFALRFKPNGAGAVANALVAWIVRDDLPVAGMVVPIGIGFPENNL